MEAMDTQKRKTAKGKMLCCSRCTEMALHCEAVCPSCLSGLELEEAVHQRLTKLAVRLVDWAEEFEGFWADGSDAEVAFDEILEEARDLLPPGGRDAN
jgi:hypothetical protein